MPAVGAVTSMGFVPAVMAVTPRVIVVALVVFPVVVSVIVARVVLMAFVVRRIVPHPRMCL
ncbi:hypothetical protein SAXI111661_17960 [Saccharomonospora xinjiangensis]|uniref:hypothetical protein n=1 Tax=Saccharomonospora xinjiangensis TaxID=75294 RepID=UPI0010C58CDD|nr:hypothetical protein [Saccharomonospora xinjiangensis]QBQ60308.1 hypothetical protein EYD13_09760 [Saccharomonospora xinjiangensis]